MSGKISLSDERMEEVRASEAFRDLEPGTAAALEELLYAADGVPEAEAASRLDRELPELLPDPGPIRRVLQDALGVR